MSWTGRTFSLICMLILGLGAISPPAKAGTSVIIAETLKPWTGDLDGIIERGYLRIAAPHNPLFLTFGGDKAFGLVAERARELESYLKDRVDAPISVVVLPIPRDQQLDALIEGRADVVDANLTITPDRADRVAFTDPLRENVSEIVITGSAADAVSSFDDLVTVGLHLRRSSSYFEHVERLNAERATAGKPKIPVVPVDQLLEDHDLLEMVQAGVIPATVVDDHKASLWAQVFDSITLHEDLAVNEGGQIAMAVRQDAPELNSLLNGFVETVRKGTLLGNIFDKRYLDSADWIERINLPDKRAGNREIVSLIRKYASEYEVDWMLVVAQAFQESRLDQSKRSDAGAIGVMQVLPSTASDPKVGIDDISDPDNNIHAGVRYLSLLRDTYFDDPEITELDRLLLSLAAYNAGPGNIAKSRKRAESMGLDPNRWFSHVEVATQRAVSREPVVYVRNIFKYSVSLRLMQDLRASEAAAMERATPPKATKQDQ